LGERRDKFEDLEGSEELDRDDEEYCGKAVDELEEFSNKMRDNLLRHERAEEARAANGGRPTSTMGTVVYLLRLLIYSREGLDNSAVTIEVYEFCNYFVLKL